MIFYIIPTVAVLVVMFGVSSIVLYTSGAARRDSFQRTILWGVGLAIVGFVSGFVGPALFSESPQGPLFGIFISGPADAANRFTAYSLSFR
jgi:uncharacterized membrane protein YGL010W